MITNAEHHRRLEKKGEWRTAHKVIRCSHYFGDLASCDRAIAPGRRYFDTNEKVPDAGILTGFAVCANCANAAYSTSFLVKERTS